MVSPPGEDLKVGFDGSLKLKFRGAKVTSDAGLLAYRDLDEALGLFDLASRALNDTRSGRNQVRLWLFVLAYNLGNFLRRLALPAKIKRWSLRSLLVKLIKIGAKLVEHGRYLTFQMAEVSISREIFAEILSRIKQLRCCEA